MCKKIFIIFLTLSYFNKTLHRAVTHTYARGPMRFSILGTPTDSSDNIQLMCSGILLCLFASKYDINGSRLNYSTVSSNKCKYINTVCKIICKDKAKRD